MSICFQHLHKSFGSKKVLRGIDLEIAEGESWVILGRSGSGKSILLKCLLGLVKFEKGEILMDGQEISGETPTGQEERLKKVGMVFQSSALLDSLKIWENVAFGVMNFHRKSRKEGYSLAIERLKTVGLAPHVADLYPSEISGGMQRRVAIARAIALSPQFLLFDEPTAGLDPIFNGLISGLIRECTEKLRATTLTITHDLRTAHLAADYAAMLHEGKIVWKGKIKELSMSAHPVVRQFVQGDPEGPVGESV